MASREKKIAAAALLLLLSQDEDFLEAFEAPSPRRCEASPHRSRRQHAPSRVARKAKPSAHLTMEEEDVGEPTDQYLPEPSQKATNTDAPSRPQRENIPATERKRPRDEDNIVNLVELEEPGVPFYIPPPKKKSKKSRKSSRRHTDAIEEAGGSTSDEAATSQGNKKPKRFWSQKMYLQRERPPDHPLSEGIPYMDPSEDLKALRMSEECFETLLELVSPLIKKKSTFMRGAVSPRQRLVAVLRFLVTGQSMEALKFSTLLSPSAMNTVLPETCQAIIQVLTPKYMKFPETKKDWRKIARGFSARCDFPNCGGSLNARHVCIFKRVGSQQHVNHEGYASVILATLVDADHRFVSAEVLIGERESDESAIAATEFFQKLVREDLRLPGNTETEGALDFVFTAPDSFPAHGRVLMTYPVAQLDVHAKITYNDKVRTVNRYSENALGLLASRFGVFRSPINSGLWKVDLIVRACCAIHNFLSVEGKHEYISDDTYDHEDAAGNQILGEWRGNDDEFNYSPLETFLREPPPDGNREHYVEYFCAKLVERNLNLLL